MPRNQGGTKLRLHMMCFGRNWDPITKYKHCFRSDGSQAPPVPYEFVSLAQTVNEDVSLLKVPLPSMQINFCVVNYYSICGRLGLHQVSFFFTFTHHKCFLAFDMYVYLIHARKQE